MREAGVAPLLSPPHMRLVSRGERPGRLGKRCQLCCPVQAPVSGKLLCEG